MRGVNAQYSPAVLSALISFFSSSPINHFACNILLRSPSESLLFAPFHSLIALRVIDMSRAKGFVEQVRRGPKSLVAMQASFRRGLERQGDEDGGLIAELTLDSAAALIVDESRRRNGQSISESSALYGAKSFKTSSLKEVGQTTREPCPHCGLMNHRADRCFKKYPELRRIIRSRPILSQLHLFLRHRQLLLHLLCHPRATIIICGCHCSQWIPLQQPVQPRATLQILNFIGLSILVPHCTTAVIVNGLRLSNLLLVTTSF